MNRIVLKQIQLVNWYGFIDTVVPLSDDLTLISGENECGKSTILDAIKYAYTGDAQFNRSGSAYNTGIGKRNLVSYTRCLMDASAGVYARPAETYPVVDTHIALTYEDGLHKSRFVLGVVIETGPSEVRGTNWYAYDLKKGETLSFTYEEGKNRKTCDAKRLHETYGVKLMNKKDGVTLFMQRLGLKLPYREVSKYQRKLRNIMAYNPAAKIQEFIRDSVLEAHDVKFDKLKEAKKNIEDINANLARIRAELEDLDGILKGFDEHDRIERRLMVDDVKNIYKKLIKANRDAAEIKSEIEENQAESARLTQEAEKLEADIRAAEELENELRRALREMDVYQAIEKALQLIGQYQERLQVLADEKESLESFEKKSLQMIQMASEDTEKGQALTVPERVPLCDPKVDSAGKRIYAEQLKAAFSAYRDEMVVRAAKQKEEEGSIRHAISEQQEIIEACRKSRPDYSRAKEETALAAEINKALKTAGMDAEARLACEYVAEIRNEAWRDAIEAFLARHRYAVIVPPEAFETANAVMDRSTFRYVELVNTRLLMRREPDIAEDALFHQLVIHNEIAARYFGYWLGRIHAVERDRVADYDNAISKEGKLSRSMALTYVNFRRIGSYALGAEAVRLNLARAEKEMRSLEEQERKLFASQRQTRERENDVKAFLELFSAFNYDAHKQEAETAGLLEEERRHHTELLEAQKSNDEFMTLNRQLSETSEKLKTWKAERTQKTNRIGILSVQISEKEKIRTQKEQEAEEKRDEIEQERMRHVTVTEEALAQYDAFLAGEKNGSDVMRPETRKRREQECNALKAEIRGKQQTYNNRKAETERLPEGLDQEAAYQARRGKIWIDDLQGVQKKLRDQTVLYERIFKHEFVLSIYEAAKDARADIAEINRELRKLRFSTRYQFDVRFLDNHTDYAKILRYAEYLQKTNNLDDEQISFTALHGYENEDVQAKEEEIRNIINRMIDLNDTGELQRFADYRNYMSYEIIINNDSVKDGKLSKQVGYNSGAGTQIPYTLILSASLSMLYNARENAVRLIFIDEPFEKMSDHNIRLMLDFFRAQSFQVIFCAPPNKLESIGSSCGVIIPVLKISNDNMQIGQVRFHEQG